MQTYYQASAQSPERLPLTRDRDVKVLVIGAGFAGLNSAFELAERGVRDVLVVEAEALGHGASGRNGGFVFSGYSLGEAALLRRFGPELAARMYRRTVSAVNTLRTRIHRLGIACEVQDHGVVWANWFRDPEVLRRRQRLLAEHYQAEWQWLAPEALAAHVRSPRYHAGLFEPNAFHLHPLKYLHGLVSHLRGRGVAVHDHSRVTALRASQRGWLVTCGGHQISAEHVVVACGGYLDNLVPALQRALMPIATYVMVSEPRADLSHWLPSGAAIYDSRFAFDYYRRLSDQRLLWGGRISIRERTPASVAALLTRDLQRVFPALEGLAIAHAWSGLMSYARHEMPQIGQLKPGLWYAQGFGGHGLAPTQVAGELLAGAIADGERDWLEFQGAGLEPVFGPLGRWAAQATYSWLQACDAWKDWREA